MKHTKQYRKLMRMKPNTARRRYAFARFFFRCRHNKYAVKEVAELQWYTIMSLLNQTPTKEQIAGVLRMFEAVSGEATMPYCVDDKDDWDFTHYYFGEILNLKRLKDSKDRDDQVNFYWKVADITAALDEVASLRRKNK